MQAKAIQIARLITLVYAAFYSLTLGANEASIEPIRLSVSENIVLSGYPNDEMIQDIRNSGALVVDRIALRGLKPLQSCGELAERVLESLTRVAAKHGAQRAMLAVEAENESAQKLYRRLGMRDDQEVVDLL